MWDQDAEETKNLISIWDLIRQNKEINGNIKELEAATQMVTSSPRAGTRSVSPTKPIIERDLTAEDDDQSQKVSEIQPSRRINKKQTQLESSLAAMGDTGVLAYLNYLTKRCWPNSSLKMCGWTVYDA